MTDLKNASLEDLIGWIAPRWQQEFQQFIDTGEATEEFLKYMDSDERCQAAVEHAFDIKAAGLEGLAQALSKTAGAPSSAASVESDVWMSTSVVAALEQAASLPSAVERETVLREAVAQLRRSVAPDQRRQLASVLSSLDA